MLGPHVRGRQPLHVRHHGRVRRAAGRTRRGGRTPASPARGDGRRVPAHRAVPVAAAGPVRRHTGVVSRSAGTGSADGTRMFFQRLDFRFYALHNWMLSPFDPQPREECTPRAMSYSTTTPAESWPGRWPSGPRSPRSRWSEGQVGLASMSSSRRCCGAAFCAWTAEPARCSSPIPAANVSSARSRASSASNP